MGWRLGCSKRHERKQLKSDVKALLAVPLLGESGTIIAPCALQVLSDAAVLKRQAKEIEELRRMLEGTG